MWKNLGSKAKQLLIKINNQVWLYGDEIEEWYDSAVIPILEPGKDLNLSDS